MLPVKHRRLQHKGIHPLHTAQVDDVLPWPPRGFAVGADAAVLAEMMLRPRPELVGGKRVALHLGGGVTRVALEHTEGLGIADGGATHDIPVIATDGFEGYKPVPTLPPYSTFVIRYGP